MSVPPGAKSGRSRVRGYSTSGVPKESHTRSPRDSGMGWDKGGAKVFVPSLPADTERSTVAERAWAKVVAAIEPQLPDATFRSWIEPIVCVGSSGEALCLQAPTDIAAWVRRRYGVLLGDQIRKNTDFKGAHIGAMSTVKETEGVF